MIREYKIRNMNFKVTTEDRICFLRTDSSEGKTFMFKTMKAAECNINRYLYYNWEDYHMICMKDDKLNDPDVLVVFDDAELYQDVVNEVIKNSKCTIIVVSKMFTGFKLGGNFGLYRINSDEHSIEMVKM